MPRKKLLALAPGVIAVMLLTSACFGDKATEPYKDAPRSGAADNSPAQVIEMPDGFSNLATKCIKGVRYTVVFHSNSGYASVSTLLDPSCRSGG